MTKRATSERSQPAVSHGSAGSGFRLPRREFLRLVGLSSTGLIVAMPASAHARWVAAQAPAALASGDPVERLAAALDHDLERIFRFVSDKVRYQPYVGVLRGARGTLSARAGNSADQAALLASLLGYAGVPYRFAFGPIDGATADAIAVGAVAEISTLRQEALAALLGADDLAASPAGTALGDDQANERAAEVTAWAREQLDLHVGTIVSGLQKAGILPPTGFTELPLREREQHAWIQVSSEGDWVDLDPTLPAIGVGRALAEVSSSGDALPDDLRHEVELAVIVETVAGVGLQEAEVLTVRGPADLLAGQPIILLNVPPEKIPGLPRVISGDIEGVKEYRAALLIGEDSHVSEIPIVLKTGGGLLGGLGGSDGDTTAEWIRLTVRSPDAAPVVVRREVFDRIGPAARGGGFIDLASLPPVERMDLGPDLAGEFPPALTQQWLTVSVGAPSLEDLRRSLRPDDDPAGRANVVQQYHLLSEAASLELAAPLGVRPFSDAPNVVAYTIATRPGPDGRPWASVSLDIWHRSHGELPVDAVLPKAPPPVTAGVLAHVVERLLLGDGVTGSGQQPERPPASVGAVFDKALSTGVAIRVLRDSAEAAGLPYPPDVLARLRSALMDGWVAVAPERPVTIGGQERVGWWLVDPLTGRTTDQLDDGGGQGQQGLEYADTVLVQREVIVKFVVVREDLWRAACIAGGALAATALLVEIASAAGSGDPWVRFWGAVAVGPALTGLAGGALQACLGG